jgi:hypothetical protein
MIQTRQYESAAKEAGFPNLNNACKFARVYLLLTTWNPSPLKKFFREREHETIDLLCLIDCYNQLEGMKLPGGWEKLSNYEEIKAWWLTNCNHL